MPKKQHLNIDLQASTIHWNASKVTGTHHGAVPFTSGSIDLDGDKVVTAEFTADMNKLHDVDIKDDGLRQRLETHLHSPDFFNTAQFPSATFRSTSTKKTGDEYAITGDLTIKGITKPITFQAKTSEQDGRWVADAEVKVDRTLYDIRYGSGKFFQNLGDSLIYDTFTLQVHFVAAK